MNEMNKNKIQKTLSLPNGDKIILFEMLGSPKSTPLSEVNQNIVRVDSTSKILWRVVAAPDGIYERAPYANIYFDEKGNFKAGCWGGPEYGIDIETGKIISKNFMVK